MAGISVINVCRNIPPFLRVKTRTEFSAERELQEPIVLLYRYSREWHDGINTALNVLANTLDMIEKHLPLHQGENVTS